MVSIRRYALLHGLAPAQSESEDTFVADAADPY